MKYLMFALLLLAGCTTSSGNQVLDPESFFKRDIKITFEGKTYYGAAILPRRSSYDLEMRFPGVVDLFTFRSCHREYTQEEATSSGGIFRRKENIVRFTYVPVAGLESQDYCPIEIAGYEEQKGRHAWGFIDFETPAETLPATVRCNGVVNMYTGVSMCQSLSGLIQEITFPFPVNISPDEACPMVMAKDARTFQFSIPTGRCVYAFKEKNGSRFHRLTTLGYEKIPIRGE